MFGKLSNLQGWRMRSLPTCQLVQRGTQTSMCTRTAPFPKTITTPTTDASCPSLLWPKKTIPLFTTIQVLCRVSYFKYILENLLVSVCLSLSLSLFQVFVKFCCCWIFHRQCECVCIYIYTEILQSLLSSYFSTVHSKIMIKNANANNILLNLNPSWWLTIIIVLIIS